MNKDKVRRIHTGLYTKVAKTIIDSTIGSLSDGWGENNPANEKWWRFAECVQASNGEVLIEVSTEPSKYESWSYHNKCIHNDFYSMPESDVMRKFAGWIKKTAKMEMANKHAGNQWKRDSEMTLSYLSYDENVTAADAYFVYEILLGRDNVHRYVDSIVLKVLGKKLSDEATKANEEKERQIAEKLAHRDMILKQLEAKYHEDRAAIAKQYQQLIDSIKAA